MLGQASNPLLQKAEQAIQSRVKPQFQQQLASAIHAGLHILYAPQLQETLMHRVATSHNPPKDAAAGATRMVYTLYQQSNGSLPPEILVPAAMIFAFEYLDLLAKTNGLQITPQIIDQTTTSTGEEMLTKMRITPQKLQQMQQAKTTGGAVPAPAQAAAAAPAPAQASPAASGGILSAAMKGQ